MLPSRDSGCKVTAFYFCSFFPFFNISFFPFFNMKSGPTTSRRKPTQHKHKIAGMTRGIILL